MAALEPDYSTFQKYLARIRTLPPSYMRLGMEYGLAWCARLSFHGGTNDPRDFAREVFTFSVNQIRATCSRIAKPAQSSLLAITSDLLVRIDARWQYHCNNVLIDEFGGRYSQEFGDTGDASHWLRKLAEVVWDCESWGHASNATMTQLLEPLWSHLEDLACVRVRGVAHLRAGAMTSVAHMGDCTSQNMALLVRLDVTLRQLLTVAGARVPRPGRMAASQRLARSIDLAMDFAVDQRGAFLAHTELERAILDCLNGRALLLKGLTKEAAQRTDKTENAARDAVRKLRLEGVIDNRLGLGYFRPDAPPQ